MESVKRYWVQLFKLDAGQQKYAHGALGAVEIVRAQDFDRVTAERNALQLLLNNRDDLDDQLASLEQRRYAEQQAREAAERRVEELKGWLLEARRCVLECADDEAGGPTRNEAQAMLSGIDATLNSTAEAMSHDQ